MTEFEKGFNQCMIMAVEICDTSFRALHKRYKLADPDTGWTREFFLGAEKNALNIRDEILKLKAPDAKV